MLKRAASSQLNHENWDDDEEPEQPTEFKLASADVMAKRVIKTGKRRLGGATASAASPFSKFSFGSAASNSTASAPTANAPAASTGSTSSPPSGFSFLSKPINGMSDPADQKDDPSAPNDPKRSEYLGKLKGLNEEVISWMKACMDKNPFCIFTPVFEDYNTYLKKIKEERDSKLNEPATTNSGSSSATGTTTSSSPAPSPFSGFQFAASAPLTRSATPSFFSSNPLTSPPDKNGKPEEKPKPLGNSIFGNLPNKPGDAPSPFSFGNAKPFSFGNAVAAPPSSGTTAPSGGDGNADDEEPPKNDFKPVTEDDAIFSQRTKVFVKNADSYSDRGVGMLYIKKVDSKYQVIVRADTSLGNLILNIILNESMPIKRMERNNLLLVCVPIPDKGAKPVPTILKVKTKEEADKLFEELCKYKKQTH